MKKNLLLFSLLTIFAGIFVMAQNGTDREPTVEEVYLQDRDYMIIAEIAFAPERESKIQALEALEEMMDNGEVANGDPEAHLILRHLSQQGTTHIVYEGIRRINYYPEVRRQACNLLGRLGGSLSVNTLIDVLLQDDEPMVLAEAVYALGEIGRDEEGRVSRAIAYALEAQTAIAPDDNFAWASMLAIEKIAEENGGISEPTIFTALVHVAQGNYISDVRMKAYQVLQDLRDY
jgi:hypothetical protein